MYTWFLSVNIARWFFLPSALCVMCMVYWQCMCMFGLGQLEDAFHVFWLSYGAWSNLPPTNCLKIETETETESERDERESGREQREKKRERGRETYSCLNCPLSFWWVGLITTTDFVSAESILQEIFNGRLWNRNFSPVLIDSLEAKECVVWLTAEPWRLNPTRPGERLNPSHIDPFGWGASCDDRGDSGFQSAFSFQLGLHLP